MKRIATLLTALLFLTGCGADSLLPWLNQDHVIPCNREWLGEWFVNVGGSKRQHRVVIELREQPQRDDLKVKEHYMIQVWTPNGERSSYLMGHLFNVHGVQLLMLHNFTRPEERELSSVETYTLWRAEGDKDNLMLWIPEFTMEAIKPGATPPVKMVKAGHEHEQPIFTDTTENLQAFVEKWAKTYEESDIKMPFGLYRKGKEFKIPPGVKKKG